VLAVEREVPVERERSVVDVQVLRVFTDPAGQFGNPLGVVLRAAGLTDEDRQLIATELGYSETIFFDDLDTARLRIFTPACELPFAGHPLVGAAWLVARETGRPPGVLRPALLSEPVPTFVADGAHWVRGRVADAPDWELVRLGSVAEVDSQQPPERGGKWQRTLIWAWSDEPAGIVRARVFALDYDVIEDEATGSAALKLVAQLGRPVTIRQGKGSLIAARPAGEGNAEVGGQVVHDSRRTVQLRGGHQL